MTTLVLEHGRQCMPCSTNFPMALFFLFFFYYVCWSDSNNVTKIFVREVGWLVGLGLTAL